jgi:hypothetical protein
VLEGEHEAGIVRVVIQVERELAEGVQPILIDLPPRVFRLIIGAPNKRTDVREPFALS